MLILVGERWFLTTVRYPFLFGGNFFQRQSLRSFGAERLTAPFHGRISPAIFPSFAPSESLRLSSPVFCSSSWLFFFFGPPPIWTSGLADIFISGWSDVQRHDRLNPHFIRRQPTAAVEDSAWRNRNFSFCVCIFSTYTLDRFESASREIRAVEEFFWAIFNGGIYVVSNLKSVYVWNRKRLVIHIVSFVGKL